MSEPGDNRPRELKQWLGESGLGGVRNRARQLHRQEQRLWRALSRYIDGNWRLARLDERELVLAVESPACASAARYRQRQILQAAAEVLGTRPKRIRFKIAALSARPRPVEKPTLSEDAVSHIEEAARATDNDALREALQRLARRGRAKSGRESGQGNKD